jgi:MOSC domain-containing protein YiiM
VDIVIRQIFVSTKHNYFGHHGQPAGGAPTVEVNSIECVAGRGIAGDRFFDYKPDYKGQITFFAWETYEEIRHALSVPGLTAAAFRRNVLVAGMDLKALENRRFTIQGVLFEGAGEAKPCYWMNQAVADGAEAWLAGRGGLRARIICSGRLTTGPAQLSLGDEMLRPASAAPPTPA